MLVFLKTNLNRNARSIAVGPGQYSVAWIRSKAREHRQILIGGFVCFNDHVNPSLVRTTELFAVNTDRFI